MDAEEGGGLFVVAVGLGPGFDDGGAFGLGKAGGGLGGFVQLLG